MRHCRPRGNLGETHGQLGHLSPDDNIMRTEIDVLLSRIEHEALRAELRSQIGRLQSRRTFGLVFESHPS